jgi:hypothetical protein
MMDRSTERPDAPARTADRVVVGFVAVGDSGVLAPDSATGKLDEAALVALVSFFRVLDRWHRDANFPC